MQQQSHTAPNQPSGTTVTAPLSGTDDGFDEGSTGGQDGDGWTNEFGAKREGSRGAGIPESEPSGIGAAPPRVGAEGAARDEGLKAAAATSTLSAIDLPSVDRDGGAADSVLRLEVEAAGGVKPLASAARSGVAESPTLGQSATGVSDAEGAFRTGVSRGLGAVLQQKGGSLTIQLSPASLGSLRIQMTLGDGQVSVRMETINEQAQQMLMRSMPMLKDSLESKGLTVREIQVTPSLHQAGGAQQSGDARQHSSQDQQGWDDGRGDDQNTGGGDRRNDGEPGRDHEDAHGELSEQWFESRLRMTLNAVA